MLKQTCTGKKFIWGFLLFGYVGISLYAFPQKEPMTWSDSVHYLATANHIKYTGMLETATYQSADLFRYQTTHYAPIHKPAYMLTLSAWLRVFPQTSMAFGFNLLLYALTLFLLFFYTHSLSLQKTSKHWGQMLLLLCFPLGLPYANTLMMEVFVLCVGSLLFLSWSVYRDKYTRQGQEFWVLMCFYLFSFIAYMTRETLLIWSIAIVLTQPLAWIHLHRQALRRSILRWFGLIGLIGSFAYLIVSYSRLQKATYWNFVTQLSHMAPGRRLAAIWRRIQSNTGHLFTFKNWPHDMLYIYFMVCVVVLCVLVWKLRHQRTKRAFRFNLTVLLAWCGIVLVVFALYDNFDWRSHRVFMVHCLLSNVGFLLWMQEARLQRWVRRSIWGVYAVLQIIPFVACMHLFSTTRSRWANVPIHPLTRMNILRSNDLVVYSGGYHLLSENPTLRMVTMTSEHPSTLHRLVRLFRPRFFVLRTRYSLHKWGYRRLHIKYRWRSRRARRVVWIRTHRATHDKK